MKIRKKKKPKRVKMTRDTKRIKEHFEDQGLEMPVLGIKRIKFGGARRVTAKQEETFKANIEGQRNLIGKKAPRREPEKI